MSKQVIHIKKLILLLICLLTTVASYAQLATVSGIVVDDNNVPLPGVSVLEKGTTNGAITNFDGEFKVKVKKDAVLVFSFIGFKTHREKVGGQTKLKVMLKTDVKMFDQVVVVGYGTKNIKDVTGSISSVKSEELTKAPVANFDEALSGRMAGVYVSPSDAQPGESAAIVIRGGNSITGDNSPLFVVDGVPMEDFDPGTLSMSDIATYDILKDASATAIYGSRGANGVVMITTKSGKSGKTSVHFKVNSGLSWIPNRLEVLDPYEFVKLQEEVAYARGGENVDNFINHWQDPELYKGKKGTSWQDEIFRTAKLNDYSVDISGGSNKTKYYTSLGYVNKEGTLLNTGFKKFNGSLRVDHKLNDRVKFGVNLRYSKQERYGVKVASNTNVSVISDAITFRPISPIVDDGLDDGIDLTNANNLRFNPVKTLENTHNVNKSSELRTVFTADFKLAKGLNFKANGAYVDKNGRKEVFYTSETLKAKRGNQGIHGSLADRSGYILSTSDVLTYDKTLGNHKIGSLLGYEFSKNTSDNFTGESQQIPFESIGVHNLGLGTQAVITKSGKTENTMLSYFSRLDYSYKEKYILNASFRMDGSSRFKGANKWGYFPAVSGAWRLVEESFIRDLNVFSNLKLRGGWGSTGNNRVPDYVTFNTLTSTTATGYTYAGNHQAGYLVTNMADSNLKWETTQQFNLGLDMGFFDNKLSVTVDAYKKNTKDLLLNARVAPSSSFTSVWTNVGEVENKGVEVSITSRNISNKNFKWDTNFNISMNRNKVVRLTDGATELLTNPGWNPKINENQYISSVGEAVGQFYGLKSDGLYQVDDFVYDNSNGYTLKEGIPTAGKRVVPGSVKYKDLNGDGTIDHNDRTVIGSAQPLFYGGITNNFKYKGWELSIFFQGSYGNDIYNMNKVQFETPKTVSNKNYFSSVANRYTPTNPNTQINIVRGEGAVTGFPVVGNEVSDRVVEDGSFLKLKTLSLGYSFDKKLLKKIGFKQFKVVVAAQNLFTITNYSGYDPEVSCGRMGALSPGLDYSAYPASTTVTVGLNITL
ncbi:MAG: SusC/RagA family TonB-linked outer membrane protein [Prolixibacteraceae bacterium]